MTLKEIQEYDRAWLTCAQIAPVLGADPYAIHLQAHANPEKLGFPVIVAGRRVKIPRIPFLKFLCGE